MPAGRYQISVGDHERGFVDGGSVQVLAGELAEVHVALGASAHVGEPFDDAIPPGHYVLAIEAPDFAVARIPFEVVAGQTATPTVALDELHELWFANVRTFGRAKR